MAETWQQRIERQAREMDAAVRAVLQRGLGDTELREALEELSFRPMFREFFWLWGPAISRRNRILFRPLILNHFYPLSVNVHGKGFDAWKKGETTEQLKAWKEEADRQDDVEVFRRLYTWSRPEGPGAKQEEQWRQDLLARVRATQNRAAFNTALAKLDIAIYRLDEPTALALYELNPTSARPFILSHLPTPWGTPKERNSPDYYWRKLLARTREAGDSSFHAELRRQLTPQDVWRTEVLELCKSVKDATALDAELESRHLRGHIPEPNVTADTFLELAEARGRDVLPYIMRHAHSVFPRWSFWGRRSDTKGLMRLLELAHRNQWLELWSTLLRISASAEIWNEQLRKLVADRLSPEEGVRHRLLLMAGSGREWHMPGVSFAQVQPLDDATAVALYERFPDLMRGPFRMHAASAWQLTYPQLTKQAIALGDAPLIDYLASRMALQAVMAPHQQKQWESSVNALAQHYEALSEADGTFARRAANALSMMPAYAVWNYDQLLRINRLARLLFERSTDLFLADEHVARDLLESPQIHVQVLALKVLGRNDARARTLAVRNVDHLQAMLLRPLHRRTRLLAFAALRNAALEEETVARRLLERMRDALALPDKRYPKEHLIGLMGQVLHRWPALRAPAELPRVYGEATP
ncbi:gliding motility protein [Hyalangium versicolor]|uniref:gliding motility protein n=1 Tax=Hyalangium versicolor TaxID=2861190 RepID=UPI001CCA46E9|nr:gliding motility protein [Hyalangium versicolor]